MKTTKEGFLMDTLLRIPRHLVKALAAGAVLIAATLPLAVASTAGAATPVVLSTFVTTPASIGAGGSATVAFTGTGFAYNGGTVTLATTATNVTFSSVVETSATTGTAKIATTSATVPGAYGVTLTDTNGTSAAAAGVLTINADPTVTGISITSVAQSQTTASVTVTGTGFATGTTAVLTSATDGTKLVNNLAYASATTLTGTVTGTTLVGANVATVGTYSLTAVNLDGGTGTLASGFSVTASGITNVSPSEIPATATATPITIAGAGFLPGATVTISGAGATNSTVVTADTIVVSPNTITTAITTASSSGLINVTVTNQSSEGGAVIVGTAVLGAATEATGGAVITTAVLSPNSPIVVGTSATTPETLTITGSGFGTGSTVEALYGTTPDSNVVFTCTASAAGTSLTCSVAVNSGATAGADSIVVINNAVASAPSANAFNVAGPVLTSAAPTALAVGSPVGTVVTITGSGFNGSATALIGGSTGLAGQFAVTSPTTATLYVQTAPTAAGTATITVSQTVSSGVTVKATPFSYKVDAAPTVTSLVNATTKASAVGAGAVNVPVIITGTGFATGATIGKFVNAYNVADAGVTATVSTVTATSMTVLVTIAATDANVSDGYTITNTDGGSISVAGFTANTSLFIAAAPTITSVTPAAGTASGTSTFTIVGTNFGAGAVVTTTPVNGTCGITTVVSSTTLTVACTLGVAGKTATSLLVTNTNGGSVTSAAILPAATPPVVVTTGMHTTGVHGSAVVGKTVTVTISGTGFYGQPKITSNEAGTRASVSKDSGKLLTVRVTVKAGSRTGEHTFTIRLANGKSAKANYSVKK